MRFLVVIALAVALVLALGPPAVANVENDYLIDLPNTLDIATTSAAPTPEVVAHVADTDLLAFGCRSCRRFQPVRNMIRALRIFRPRGRLLRGCRGGGCAGGVCG